LERKDTLLPHPGIEPYDFLVSQLVAYLLYWLRHPGFFEVVFFSLIF
jgi:hypothetical protein